MFLFVDEVGYGAWAGPVVCCAVQAEVVTVLEGSTLELPIEQDKLRSTNCSYDSKSMSKKSRESIFTENFLRYRWRIGWSTAEEISSFGIRPATDLAIKRSLFGQPEVVFIDGIVFPKNAHPKIFCVKKGDKYILEIGLASVFAKVIRDRYMSELDKLYPGYFFDKNVGYGTKKHHEGLQKNGITPEHRLNYEPISNLKVSVSAYPL